MVFCWGHLPERRLRSTTMSPTISKGRRGGKAEGRKGGRAERLTYAICPLSP